MPYNSDRSFGLICFVEDIPAGCGQPVDPEKQSEWDSVYDMVRRNLKDLPDDEIRAFADQIVSPEWAKSLPNVGPMAVGAAMNSLDNPNR